MLIQLTRCKRWAAAIGAALLWVWAPTGLAADADNPTPRPQVVVKTNLGNFTLELYPNKAPVTVKAFLALVAADFYQGLTFHRVAPNFVIQAGGYDAQLNYRDPPGTLVNESFNGLKNRKGFVAMARLEDPDSADTQFFINVRDNAHLDPQPGKAGYTVFGRVIAGWPAVENIELVDTGIAQGMVAVPLEPVIIENIQLLAAQG